VHKTVFHFRDPLLRIASSLVVGGGFLYRHTLCVAVYTSASLLSVIALCVAVYTSASLLSVIALCVAVYTSASLLSVIALCVAVYTSASLLSVIALCACALLAMYQLVHATRNVCLTFACKVLYK
jgi:hypothetical protein